MPKQIQIDPMLVIQPGDRSIYATTKKADEKYYTERGKYIDNVILIPVDEDVYFPYMTIGHIVKDPQAIASLKKAYNDKEPVFLFLASDTLPEDLRLAKAEDVVNSEGALGFIMEILENADGSLSFNAAMWHRGSIIDLRRRTPYMRGPVRATFPTLIEPTESQQEIGQKLEEAYMKMAVFLSEEARTELKKTLEGIPSDSIRRLYFMIQNSPIKPDDRYYLLGFDNFADMREHLLALINEEMYSMQLRAETHQKAMSEFGTKQREEILRAHLQQIKRELGETDDSDEEELRNRSLNKEWDEETGRYFEKELRKLMRYNPTSPDYALQYAFLDTFLNLPWQHIDNSDFTLQEVEEVLNRDHYALEKVKERIVEQMAVLKLRGDTKAPILCLYGPPGVGKTSLGKSVAEALGRKYVRVALGGLHDEAEIRGHRRTYLGSMPGRILSALEKCGTSDPVMVLDEIDKIGADYKGDPAQALLEVLDPEQNFKFHDNYIDHDYDLSKVLFIATANSLQGISAPLLDRMELIEIGGYVEAEKIEIAKRHVLPKSLKEHGFDSDAMKFDDEALLEIIKNYTRESGVRQLEKKINNILRKQAMLKASGKKMPKTVTVELVAQYLGKPEIFNDTVDEERGPGVVTGLAWTQAGGDILFIESSIAPGKEGKLTLTGNLGDVMKESATLALQYVKANSTNLGIPEDRMTFGTVHVHVPEGAVPKDGPSAGITIATSLVSSFSGRKVKPRVAMTGELTLTGKVLPVGGIREKILAAKRAGVNTIIMSSKNRKDVEEIKPEYVSGLEFHYVDSVEEVFDLVLLR